MTSFTNQLGADVEDIEDLLKTIEKSYNIRFQKDELKSVLTFGELCDIILNKIELTNVDDCTSQQAFYKLRDAIAVTQNSDKAIIKSDTTLSSLFPKNERRKQMRILERNLGFDLNILKAPSFYTWASAIAIILSIVAVFWTWTLAVSLITFAFGMIAISKTTGRIFEMDTVGELAEIMSQQNYLKSRRHPETVNRAEIVNQIEKLFLRKLVTDLKEIKRDTVIVESKLDG
jgi:hypothetical protein